MYVRRWERRKIKTHALIHGGGSRHSPAASFRRASWIVWGHERSRLGGVRSHGPFISSKGSELGSDVLVEEQIRSLSGLKPSPRTQQVYRSFQSSYLNIFAVSDTHHTQGHDGSEKPGEL